VVHARKVGDRELTFRVSGRLWRDSLVMQDEETGTYWSQVTGEAMAGALEGTKLTMLPTVQTTWKRWIEQHPDTTLLKKSREVRGSQYSAYFEDPEKMGLFRSRRLVKALPPKSLIHGIRSGLHALAVPDDSLQAGESADTTLGDERVRVTRSPDGGVRAHRLDAEGMVAEELPVTVAFWFAWITFYPNTTVWSGQ
jgi:hypothetical protein